MLKAPGPTPLLIFQSFLGFSDGMRYYLDQLNFSATFFGREPFSIVCMNSSKKL